MLYSRIKRERVRRETEYYKKQAEVAETQLRCLQQAFRCNFGHIADKLHRIHNNLLRPLDKREG